VRGITGNESKNDAVVLAKMHKFLPCNGQQIRETEMKRTMKLGVIGLMLAVGIAESKAQPSNWVQSATFTLKAYVSGAISAQSLNNKALISFLSGGTSTNSGGGTTTFTTNISVTPSSGVAEFDVTNDTALGLSTNNFVLTNIFNTNGALVFSNFPASLTASNVVFFAGTNAIVTNNIALSRATNASTPTYTFANTSTSNSFGYTNVFAITNASGTNLEAPYVSAVLQTNSTTNQLIFSLEYSLLVTNITTNTIAGTNITLPTFDKTAKVVFVTPIGSGSLSNGLFEVQTGTGKNLHLTDISAFLELVADANATPVALGNATYSSDGIDGDVTSSSGNPLTFTAQSFFKSQSKSTNIKGVGKETVLGNASGTALGRGSVGGSPFVFEGTVNISGGTAE